jgi:hypothetical protein
MSEEQQLPLTVEKIECASLGREKVAVHVSGRWRGRRWSPDTRAFLVVAANGRRHRFPAIAVPSRRRLGRASTWSASFALPASLEAQLGEQLSLWLGDVEIPLPPVSYMDNFRAAVEGDDGAMYEPEEGEMVNEEGGTVVEDEAPFADAVPSATAEAAPVETARTDALVAALRAELRERAAAEARLRAELSKAQGELDRRIAVQGELQSIQAELEEEFGHLRDLIEQERVSRGEVESRAAQLHAELEAACGEAEGLRSELDRLGSELADVRGSRAPAATGLSQAQELLAEARAVRTKLCELAERRQERVND